MPTVHLLIKTGILLLLLGTSTIPVVRNPGSGKPNIILFFIDDMGWQDTSVPFGPEKTALNRLYHTPNMEKLAAEGMKFTQAYASSVCSPTRVSLMTGMNAARHRVTNWTLRRNISEDHKDSILEMPKWNMNGLQPVDSIENAVYATTLAQLLQQNGYFTIHCGKAHWGAMDTPGADPLNLGFDVNIGGHAAGAPGSYQGERNYGNKNGEIHTLPWGVPGLSKYHGKTIHLTEALTLEAISAIEQARKTNRPFFLNMSHYAVHTPLEADTRFYEKYKKRGMEEPEARFASMVEGMDKSLGDIMAFLSAQNLEKNTIILFMSDNGSLSATARGGEKHTHNLPLKSGKGSAYEGGIREPMLVKWPGKVLPGSVCNQPLIIEDFFPSILEIAGIQKNKTVQQVDGKSFVPLLKQKGTTSAKRIFVWHYPNKWGASGPGIGTTSTIRQGNWKLIYWYCDGTKELYHLDHDLGEQENLTLIHPEKVNELSALLGNYLRTRDAVRPIFKQTNKTAPWPDELF
jgi:arylsulfatase A-like enzyme